MSQIAVTQDQGIAFAGQIVDCRPYEMESKVNEESANELAFGWLIRQGAGDRGALKCLIYTQGPRGIIAHSHTYAKGGSLPQLGTTGVLPKNMLNIMRAGCIWVVVGAAVTANARAWYHVGTQRWHAADVTGSTIDCTAVASFVTSQSTVGGLAQLECDFRN